MRRTTFIICILFLPVMVYSNIPDTTCKPVSKEKLAWFEKGEWRAGWEAMPDGSMNVNAFYGHYMKHELLWEIVFEFLADTDLLSIKPGQYPLAGDSLFAIVDEYTTQDEAERKYEAHRKYIDLQYIISGQELIGIAKLNKQEVLEPYKEDRDIAFYNEKEGEYRHADNNVFFIFFPDDLHQPCVKVEQCAPVRKIVFKIISDQ